MELVPPPLNINIHSTEGKEVRGYLSNHQYAARTTINVPPSEYHRCSASDNHQCSARTPSICRLRQPSICRPDNHQCSASDNHRCASPKHPPQCKQSLEPTNVPPSEYHQCAARTTTNVPPGHHQCAARTTIDVSPGQLPMCRPDNYQCAALESFHRKMCNMPKFRGKNNVVG